jgi:leucyl-tRNA synthetase
MFKAGLAYKAEIPINWCPECKVSLANEEVVDGRCERCNAETVRKNKSQWMLRITRYADRLIQDLDTVDYIDPVKIQQRNWIGKSTGAEIYFQITGTDEHLTVFTTRADTIFGATYMVVSPEHPVIDRYADRIANIDAVRAYRLDAAKKNDMERANLLRDKTGLPLAGLTCTNPATGREIPLWVSDYVLMSYGTGAIMAVPGHDERDWEFARTFALPIIEVIAGGDVSASAYTDIESGTLVNSGFLNGLSVKDAIARMIAWLGEKGLGKAQVNYKLRDWVFSRQRYWGEPIPLVQCPDCGWVPLPEAVLPLTLPEIENFKPSAAGESPLIHAGAWLDAPCPKCGKPGQRETDTMPQWAGSCWYFMRYLDPDNDTAFADPKLLEYWLPVDWYNGGMEHTTLHLLYSRFWYKFMYDEKLVPTSEPYQRRTSHGMILGEDNEKMSKSRGNVVNPDDVVAHYGADTMRLYEMAMGAFDQKTAWKESGVVGVYRFLTRVWNLQDKAVTDLALTEADRRLEHKTIRNVGERIERMKFNTAIAALQEWLNAMGERPAIPAQMVKTFLVLCYPFAPHLASELWQALGEKGSLTYQPWPTFDPELAKDELITVPIQINGKLRDTLEVEDGLPESELFRLALERDKVQAHLQGKAPKKIINVKGRLISIVV